MKKWKPNCLFRSGPDWGLNACVGDNGGPYDFNDYGRGFFVGARQMVEAAQDDRFLIDVNVYPIVFCFRHGIELYLKHLLQLCSRVLRTNERFVKNHKLQDNWIELERVCASAAWTFVDKTELSIAGDIIEEFCEIDPSGQVFRYPEDIKGNRHLTGLAVINVEVLKDGMEILEELLDKWANKLQALLDAEADAQFWCDD